MPAMDPGCEIWALPPSQVELAGGEVHVWHLHPLIAPSPDCLEILSPDEWLMANRLRQEADHDRFVICRSQLRRLLGTYASTSPTSLHFHYGSHGKPFLGDSDLRFNVSHAGEHGLIAISRQIELGVDIEPLNLSIDAVELSKQFFTPAEAALVADARVDDRSRIFLALWTAKEAYLKAKGAGLSEELSQTDFSTAAFDGGDHLFHDPNGATWHVRSLHPDQTVAAALATQAAPRAMALFRYQWH
jgi:4'-phosphopantetheinyl transferase